MPNYQEGKIYKITSEQLPGKYYIGSTTNTLKKRLWGHRTDYNRYLKGTRHKCSSSIIICYPDAKITLIEEFPCECKKELEKREGVIIRCYMKEHCLEGVVNRQIAGRSNKEWDNENKERVAATKKVWRQANKERINEKERVKRLENKEWRDNRNRKARELYHAKKTPRRLENKEWRDEDNRKRRERYHAKKII